MIELRLAGKPRPQGSKTASLVGWKPGQKSRPTVVMFEAGKEIKRWRKWARQQLEAAWDDVPIDRPVRLRLEFLFDRPKSHYTSKGALRKGAPPAATTAQLGDLSKLIRAVEDAMVDAGVLEDDRLVVKVEASKRWVSPRPPIMLALGAQEESQGVLIRIEEPHDQAP